MSASPLDLGAVQTQCTRAGFDGGTVPGAAITAIGSDGRRFRSENADGIQAFAPLPPGDYVRDSHAPGFSHTITTVSLLPGANEETVFLAVQTDLIV